MTEGGVVPVIVVVPPRVMMLDVAGPIEVLRRANLEQDRVRFAVRYVGPAPELLSSVVLVVSGIEPLPDVLPEGAWIVVAGAVDQPFGTADLPVDAASEAAIVDWLRHRVKPSHTLVTICSGAISAGRAGLLDGRLCTSHEASIAALRACAPRARVVENRLFVEAGNVFTSAGVTAGTDLMLHLLADRVGHLVTLAVARYLVVYLRRAGSAPQVSPWLEGRNHLRYDLHGVQDAVVADPAGPWTAAHLADLAGTSPRNLSRLFARHVGMSPVEFVARIRVAAARDILVGSDLTIEHIAGRVGFGSARHFRRAWAQVYRQSPAELRDTMRGAGPPL